MLEIHYSPGGGPTKVARYEKVTDFLSAEYLEVPPFADSDRVTKVLLDGQDYRLDEPTIEGLFRALGG